MPVAARARSPVNTNLLRILRLMTFPQSFVFLEYDIEKAGCGKCKRHSVTAGVGCVAIASKPLHTLSFRRFRYSSAPFHALRLGHESRIASFRSQ
jgi:hypothetical protein